MESPFGRAVVIANPRAGKGRVGRNPDYLPGLLSAAGMEFEFHLTTRRGHATELARRALEQGSRFLVAVGGDGTIHEVVNGMMGEEGPVDPEAVLGLVAAGSGSDFIRTFGLPAEAEDAVKHLRGENFYEIDVGRVSCERKGRTHTEYFNNIAEVGFGADVVRKAEKLPRFVGRVRYLLGFWITLASFRINQAEVVMDGRAYQGALTNLVVANAQFFGGGMHIAPKAHPGDGIFDVLIQTGTKRDYVAGITKVYKGEHLSLPAIRLHHAKVVEVRPAAPLRVEADGENLGMSPAKFEIVPRALRIKL